MTGRIKQLAWFIAIWTASVLALGAISLVLRMVLKSA